MAPMGGVSLYTKALGVIKVSESSCGEGRVLAVIQARYERVM
jgi:hypothetical protein